ncbi:MAG: hypothetical protein WBP33_00860 [Saprospiraceae bacterium]
MTETLNLIHTPPLHKTSVNGSALQLSKIEVNQEYLNEWNENCKDFVVLSKNGEILRNTLYRVGGLNNPKVGIDKYFMLLKYSEDLYTFDFIKKCYPKITKKEQEKRLKHLKSEWVILDFNGNEKVVVKKSLDYAYLVKDSCIYSIGRKYYNIETGFCYGDSSTSMKSSEFLFLDNQFEKDETKKGIMKINLKDGSWQVFQ